MVLSVDSHEGHVMPPHFIPRGLKVNAAVYSEVLNKVVKLWINNVCIGRPCVFQQDSTPSHVVQMTQVDC